MAIMALNKVQGQVRVRNENTNNQWVKGYNGMAFSDTIFTIIMTDKDGRCEIVDNHGGKITLTPNSCVDLYPIGDRRRQVKTSIPEVELNTGEIKQGLAALRGQ